MNTERLIYLPLGGAGEIGINAYVYGYGKPNRERLILVDLGVAFPDMDSSPGVNLIFPDVSWLAERSDRLEAIFITHGHEDHVGAVAHHYSELHAPIYARPFTANVARMKMYENGQPDDAVSAVEPWPARVEVGPFSVGFVPITHSIPENSGLVIDTPCGRLVHSGDFKLDSSPVLGGPFDENLWRSLAKPGVQALMCDSTNVFAANEGRSEGSLSAHIERAVLGCKGMFVATTFASNVARVKTLAESGEKAGRKICLMGRAMKRMANASVKMGIMPEFPSTVDIRDIKNHPREELMLIVTGSQGERRAASAQLSKGKYNGISMKPGDTFLFSSKTIPGNERGVLRVINDFSKIGVNVIDDASDDYHVSGHANRPDLARMHDILKPRFIVPIHGEHRHLREHVALANNRGYRGVFSANGMMMDLSGPEAAEAGHIDVGRIYLDGKMKIGAYDGIIRDRLSLARDGHVAVSVVVDSHMDTIYGPWCKTVGLSRDGASGSPLTDVIEDDLGDFIDKTFKRLLAEDGDVEDEIRAIVRKRIMAETGKRPHISVSINQVGE
ncbi:MAG: ribonuclease J [Roseovarius sp.]|nr:ribonuclease J [Roseovarius sp.]MCY4317377.1 ribonuclease J [Roseovarius sp.]